MTNNHQPDAETKWFNLILADLDAAFPGVPFTCVAAGLAFGHPPGIQLEFDGNDVDCEAVAEVLGRRDYEGVAIWFDFSPGPRELERIAGIIEAPENAQALDKMFAPDARHH